MGKAPTAGRALTGRTCWTPAPGGRARTASQLDRGLKRGREPPSAGPGACLPGSRRARRARTPGSPPALGAAEARPGRRVPARHPSLRRRRHLRTGAVNGGPSAQKRSFCPPTSVSEGFCLSVLRLSLPQTRSVAARDWNAVSGERSRTQAVAVTAGLTIAHCPEKFVGATLPPLVKLPFRKVSSWSDTPTNSRRALLPFG